MMNLALVAFFVTIFFFARKTTSQPNRQPTFQPTAGCRIWIHGWVTIPCATVTVAPSIATTSAPTFLCSNGALTEEQACTTDLACFENGELIQFGRVYPDGNQEVTIRNCIARSVKTSISFISVSNCKDPCKRTQTVDFNDFLMTLNVSSSSPYVCIYIHDGQYNLMYSNTVPMELGCIATPNQRCNLCDTKVNMYSLTPTMQPTYQSTRTPTYTPTKTPPTKPPTKQPTHTPSSKPSGEPTSVPSSKPSGEPTSVPSSKPSMNAVVSTSPTLVPFGEGSSSPSALPSLSNFETFSDYPTLSPSEVSFEMPTVLPSAVPVVIVPTRAPTAWPTVTSAPTMVCPSGALTQEQACYTDLACFENGELIQIGHVYPDGNQEVTIRNCIARSATTSISFISVSNCHDPCVRTQTSEYDDFLMTLNVSTSSPYVCIYVHDGQYKLKNSNPVSMESGCIATHNQRCNLCNTRVNVYGLMQTRQPSIASTLSPELSTKPTSVKPTTTPTVISTGSPSTIQSLAPTMTNSQRPSYAPSLSTFDGSLSASPVLSPTVMPVYIPSLLPTLFPVVGATAVPTVVLTRPPTVTPTRSPGVVPSKKPTNEAKVPTRSPVSTAPTISSTFVTTPTPTMVCPNGALTQEQACTTDLACFENGELIQFGRVYPDGNQEVTIRNCIARSATTSISFISVSNCHDPCNKVETTSYNDVLISLNVSTLSPYVCIYVHDGQYKLKNSNPVSMESGCIATQNQRCNLCNTRVNVFAMLTTTNVDNTPVTMSTEGNRTLFTGSTTYLIYGVIVLGIIVALVLFVVYVIRPRYLSSISETKSMTGGSDNDSVTTVSGDSATIPKLSSLISPEHTDQIDASRMSSFVSVSSVSSTQSQATSSSSSTSVWGSLINYFAGENSGLRHDIVNNANTKNIESTLHPSTSFSTDAGMAFDMTDIFKEDRASIVPSPSYFNSKRSNWVSPSKLLAYSLKNKSKQQPILQTLEPLQLPNLSSHSTETADCGSREAPTLENASIFFQTPEEIISTEQHIQDKPLDDST